MFRRLNNLPFWTRIAIFLTILGPGIITGSVNNDPGGITTYSVAGALYGYHMLWTLIPSFFALFIVQEMNARMGIVTGKGLADLIREHTGVKVTFFVFLALLVADIGNTTTEFAGVAGSMAIFGVNKYISVPIATIGVWILVVRFNYKAVEKIFLLFSLFLLCYIISALMAKPAWGEIGTAFINPKIDFSYTYLYLIIGMIGTTIAPWMQFYMQSSVIEKGLKMTNYKYTIIDILMGSLATIVVAFFIIVACAATLHVHGIQIEEAKDAALALVPFAGKFASYVFAFGLFIAAVFSAAVLPVATAFYVCEAFGFEAGIDKKLKEAPQFYTLFTLILVGSALIILIPNAPLITITIWTQVVNGILLPVVLVSMMLLVNNKEIMGQYVNNRIQNVVGWSTIGILIGLSLILMVLSIL